MSRLRLLFAWLVLAALPLQGFAAASMLFCGAGLETKVQSSAPSQHDHGAHSHAEALKVEKSTGAGAQLPDASHTCGVCASCCHSAAITQTPRVLEMASLPQTAAAEPFVRMHARPSPVPDKPPRA